MSEANGSHANDEIQKFTEAVAIANIPTLLAVLVQLTGDLQWLDDQYRTRRVRGMNDNDTRWIAGGAAGSRSGLRLSMLSWLGAAVVRSLFPSLPRNCGSRCSTGRWARIFPTNTIPLLRLSLSLEPKDFPEKVLVPPGFEVLIIGAGVSGLCAAINLQRAGIPFTILEKKRAWAASGGIIAIPALVSIPLTISIRSRAHLTTGPMYYALRDELHAYLEHVAEKFNLRPHIRFETEVKSADYDEPSQRWKVAVRKADGSEETLNGNILISAVGIFNPIKMPNIKGLDSFKGPSFHTAQWPAGVDLKDKRVAMIGNGASAMQTGPEIQNIVKSLTIFQRSPHWVAPNEQFRTPIPEPLRFLLRELPLYRVWYRLRLGWAFGDRVHSALQKDPNWEHADRSMNKANDSHRGFFTQYIASEIGDRKELLEKVVPGYPPFGKRMLMDNGWYRMLRNEKVNLVTDPIAEIKPDRIVTKDGSEYEADVLIVATGFDVLTLPYRFRGARPLRPQLARRLG